MRITVFCAIGLGIGCDASAAELGLASYYGNPLAGGLTAAHRSLPMGSQVKVVNLDNGRAVVVRIVDRGPFIQGRIIDVSPAAALTLGFRDAGLAHVKIDLTTRETPGGRLSEPQSAPVRFETSAYKICRYGAVRLERLQGDFSSEAAASRDETGCEDLRSRLSRVARSVDLPPVLPPVRGRLTGVEAAGSIPVSAFADVEAAASIPVSALAEMEAAANIPVTAVAAGPEHAAPPPRFAGGCSAPGSCEKPERMSGTNTVLSFLARLRQIFD